MAILESAIFNHIVGHVLFTRDMVVKTKKNSMTVYPAWPVSSSGGAVLSKHIIQKENPFLNHLVIQSDVSLPNDSHKTGR